MHAVRRELPRVDVLRHAREDLVHGDEGELLLFGDGADDRKELVEEGTEALLVADGQHIGLHEEELGARSFELLDKFAVVRFKLFGGDDLTQREAAPHVVDAHLQYDEVGVFVDDVLFDARQKVCGAVAPHAAVDDLDLLVGVKQAELARRDLDVAHAEIVGIEQVAAGLGDGVAEKYDLHGSPHFAYFALYALMHFLMISTASSR